MSGSGCGGLHCPGCGQGKAAGAVTAIGAAAVLAVAVAEAAEWIAAVLSAALVIATAGYTVTRRRRRRTLPARERAQLWHPNPQASPLPPRKAQAIAAPQVVVNIDAALLAGLFQAAQQAAPVIVQPGREELPR